MMTSYGLGPYKDGGSLSSSNLSALAPPFKVDKFLPRANSTNPAVDFHDMHMHGALYDPSGPYWNSSSASGSKFAATQSMGANTTSQCSPCIYGYLGSQSSALPASIYYGGTSASGAYDPFSYEPFPNSMSPNAEEAAKPYYLSYVPSPPPEGGFMALGVGSGPGYDLLSNSGSAHLSGCGSAQVDQPQGMFADGECKLKGGSFWSGLGNSDHGKWAEYAQPQGFSSKDFNTSNASSCKSPLFVDGSNKSEPFVDINFQPFVGGSNNIHHFGGRSNRSHLKQGACMIQDLGSHGKISTVSDHCFDIFGGAYHLGSLGMDKQDCKSMLDCSIMPISVSDPTSKTGPHLQEPVPESVTNFSSSQKANGSSPDNHFSRTDYYVLGCASATSSFPTTITNLPCVGSSASAESTLSALKLNSAGNDAAKQGNTSAGYNSSYQKETHTPLSALKLNSTGNDAAKQGNTSAGYNSSYQKETHMPLDLTCWSNINFRRPASSMVASSSQIGETADNGHDDKNASEKMKFTAQVPHPFSSGDLNLKPSDAEAVYSVDKHSAASDVHNPAEDSPCWKGASSNRYSPFGNSEGVAPDVLGKNLDKCKNLSTSEPQNKSLLIDASDSLDFYYDIVNENSSFQRPSVFNCTSKGDEHCGSTIPNFHCFDLNTGDGLKFGDDCHVSTKECSTLKKLKEDSDSRGCLASQMILEEMSSARNMSEAGASEKSGNGAPVMAEAFSGTPSNIDNNLSSSPPGDKASLKYCQSPSKDSDSRIDVNLLLKTMMNLSEIFRCCCFNNRAEITEQQSVAVNHIINNLNASMLMVAGKTIPKLMLFPQGNSFEELPTAQMVNDAEAVAAAVKLGRTTGDFLDSISSKDYTNTLGNANMMEAIKKILHENLHEEEEMDQYNNLYKNLWLEAEASLCIMTAKARFHRMKSEMETTQDGRKDNPPSPIISADVNRVIELATKGKDSLALGECPKSTATRQHNSAGASSMNKFDVPNSQTESLNSMKSEGPKSTRDVCLPSFYASRLGNSDYTSDGSATTSHANDIENSVMAGYQILKDRIENSASMNCEGKQSTREYKDSSSLSDPSSNSHGSGTTSYVNDVEASVVARSLILKDRGDNSGSLNYEGKQFPGEENDLPDRDSSSPDKQCQNSELSNSIGEGSIMAGFHIIQSQVNRANSLNKDPMLGQVGVDDGNEGRDGSQQKFTVRTNIAEGEDVNMLGIGVNGEAFAPFGRNRGLCSEIFEAWYKYNNDSSSLEWEHVSKGDL